MFSNIHFICLLASKGDWNFDCPVIWDEWWMKYNGNIGQIIRSFLLVSLAKFATPLATSSKTLGCGHVSAISNKAWIPLRSFCKLSVDAEDECVTNKDETKKK